MADTPQSLAKGAETSARRTANGITNRAHMSPEERSSWDHVGDGWQQNAPGTRGGNDYSVVREARKE